MIALDCHLFSLVKGKGFTRLLRELEPRYSPPYFTENIVTNLFDNIKTKVTQAVSGVNSLPLQLIYERQM